MDILNVIMQLLTYKDSAVTDNPMKRGFDWTRKLNSIKVSNPTSDSKIIAPGETLELFNGTKSTALGGASVLSLTLLSASEARYRMTVTSGPSGFRTERSVSGISAVNVTINNSAVAVFDFTAATLTGVVPGDIMRIKGSAMYDAGPYVFNPLNSGLWKVLAVAGTQVQAVRPTGQDFGAAAENIVSGAATDVRFYSAAGIQVGEKISISGTFSSPTHRSYTLLDVSPNSVDFSSANPLPLESGLAYASGSLAFYTNSKRLVYIEVDQDAAVRFNEDTTDNNKVSPVMPGDECAPGFMGKWGDSYKVSVSNKSVNPLTVRYFLAE